MGMLFIHEYGHVFAMKRSGMKVKGIYYIPFLGAVSVSEDAWPSRKAQAYVALQGPLWGALLSIVVLVGYFVAGRRHASLGVIAAWWGVINLFNLIPMNPLDGGRLLSAVAASIHKTVGVAMIVCGMILAILLAFLLRLDLLWILGGIGLLEMLGHRKAQRLKPAYEAFLEDLDTQGIDITPFNSRELMKRLAVKLGLGRFKQGLLLQGLKRRFQKAVRSGSIVCARTAFHEIVSTTLRLKASALPPVPEMSARQIGLYSTCYVGLVLLLCGIIGIGAVIGQQAGAAAFEILK